MHIGIQNVFDAMLATCLYLIMSSLCVGITLIINLATRSATIQNVMSANTLFQQTLQVLLNIGHIPFGSRNTVLLMNMMALQGVAAVNEWSHEILDMLQLTMVESFAWNAWTLLSWIPMNANPFILRYKNSMKV
uniref:Uncharacterized protein n=2 Tax=Rhizophora mucronata TaxID=61149 RepID=A0A2P2JBT6_RHIMU